MTKSLVQERFGANAAQYATSSVHATGASLTRVVELVAPRPDWHALDIATGAGHMALAFAPHVARVTASDITPEMLTETAKLAAGKGIANLDTKLADAEALPFPDGQFDLVSSRIAPHHFPNQPRFLAEVHRVLKPGGTFALVDNVAPDTDTTPGFSADQLAAADVAYNVFEKIRDPSHGRALTSAGWRGLVAAAGFEVRHQEIMLKAMMFKAWCRNMSVPPALAADLAAMLAHAEPCLAAFLQPKEKDGDTVFMLRELVLIAVRH